MTKETNTSPFNIEEVNPFKLPGGSLETFLSSYQKKMELLTTNQQLAAESAKSILDLQREYFKGVYDQWNEHIKFCCSKAPLEEKSAHHAEISKETLDKTREHLRDLNSILINANEKIIESIQVRFKESLDESVNTAKKNRNKS